MKFTFGIITDGKNEIFINEIIDSIESQNIPEYEVIIVGKFQQKRINTKVIYFDETKKANWITRKKNIITENASYENIVCLHDYIKFANGWYQGQLKAGENYKVRVDKVFNLDGSRAGDWLLCMWDDATINEIIGNSLCCLLPYELENLSKHMYISASYYVAKKIVMQEFPWDETRSWGESDDVEWCRRVRQKYKFTINTFSSVQFLKQKDMPFKEPKGETLEKLKNLNYYYSSFD